MLHLLAIPVMWYFLYQKTNNKPLIRSYSNAISTLVCAIVSFFHRSIIKTTLVSTGSYYLLDTYEILKRDAPFKNIYLYHHIGSLMVVLPTLIFGSEKAIDMMSYIGLTIEISSITLNWVNMKKEYYIYKGLYPDISLTLLKKIFAFCFIFVRLLLGVPVMILSFRYIPYISSVALSSSIVINGYWGFKLVRILLNSDKKDSIFS